MKRAAIPALFLCGCSSLVSSAGPVIVCHATKEPVQCPPAEDGPRATQVFSSHVLPLSPQEDLEIHWYDWDESFDDTGDVAGWSDITAWPTAVHVRNHRVLMHELAHVALWREANDADPNHQEPPGPWGASLEPAIEKAFQEFGVHNPATTEEQ